MIELRRIKKQYNVVDDVQVVLEDLSYCFNKGERTAIVGESGCGKTTVLNLIGGVDNDFEGELLFEGEPVSDLDKYRREKVSFIFQDLNLIEHFNLVKNITIGLTNEVENKEEIALELLKKVGLELHATKYPNQLSGGERQRVAIARALARETDVLLCDEPTGSLDEETKTEIMDLIVEVFKDKTLIFITHDEELARDYADVILEFENKKFKVTKERSREITVNEDEEVNKGDFKRRFEINLLFRKINLLASAYLIIVIFGLYLFGTGVVYGLGQEIDEYYVDNYKVDKLNVSTLRGLTYDGFVKFSKRFNGDHNDEIIGVSAVLTGMLTMGENEREKYYSMNTMQDAFRDTIEEDIIFGRYPEANNEVLISKGAALSLIFTEECHQYTVKVDLERDLFICVDGLVGLDDQTIYDRAMSIPLSFRDKARSNWSRVYDTDVEIVGMIDDFEYGDRYRGNSVIETENNRFIYNNNFYFLEEEMYNYIEILYLGNYGKKNFHYSIFIEDEDLEVRKAVFSEFVLYSYLISGQDFLNEERDEYQDNVFGYEIAISAASLVLTIFGAISIYNGLKSNIQKNKSNVGVYKSLGYTSRNIRAMFWKEGLIISGVVLLFSILVWFILSRILGSAVARVLDMDGTYGLENVARLDLISLLIVTVVLIGVVFGSITYELKKIDIIEMIRE